jgi:hypothetical protein
MEASAESQRSQLAYAELSAAQDTLYNLLLFL